MFEEIQKEFKEQLLTIEAYTEVINKGFNNLNKLNNVIIAMESNQKLNTSNIKLSNIVLENIYSDLNYPVNKRISIDNIAKESIIDDLKKKAIEIWNAIVKWIKNIWDKIKDLWYKFRDTNNKIKQKAEDWKKEINSKLNNNPKITEKKYLV